MDWKLQLIEVVVLLVFGGIVHAIAVSLRRPLLRELEKTTGRITWSVAAIGDLVVVLVYAGFVAWVSPPPAYRFEDVLDHVGVGAAVLAAVEVLGLSAIHRIAYLLEPWPRKAAATV